MGESSQSADAGRAATRTPPWRRRVLLVPAVAVVVLFVAGFVVANLPGSETSPFASLFVGIVWSLAALIVFVVVVVGGFTVLRRALGD